MSELDAFRGAENEVGVSIWRIENFKPVRQPKTDTGRFSSGTVPEISLPPYGNVN